MSLAIYTFSATGNSLKVARDIAQHFDDVTHVFIRYESLEMELQTDADTIGFVFPTIFGGIPSFVQEFVERLQINHCSPYIFVVATHGDKRGSNFAFHQLATLLTLKQRRVSAFFSVRMPHNAPFKDHAKTLVNKELTFDQALLHTTTIAAHIQTREYIAYPKGNRLKLFLQKLIYETNAKTTFDKRFFVDDQCTGCTTCAKICPTNNIMMNVDQKPEWLLKNCQACFACVQWCPKVAIQYTKQTVDVPRYHHPDVRLKDLLIRRFDDIE